MEPVDTNRLHSHGSGLDLNEVMTNFGGEAAHHTMHLLHARKISQARVTEREHAWVQTE